MCICYTENAEENAEEKPSTKHYRKGSKGDALTQQPCPLQHSNNPPSSLNQQGHHQILSANAARCEA